MTLGWTKGVTSTQLLLNQQHDARGLGDPLRVMQEGANAVCGQSLGTVHDNQPRWTHGGSLTTEGHQICRRHRRGVHSVSIEGAYAQRALEFLDTLQLPGAVWADKQV